MRGKKVEFDWTPIGTQPHTDRQLWIQALYCHSPQHTNITERGGLDCQIKSNCEGCWSQFNKVLLMPCLSKIYLDLAAYLYILQADSLFLREFTGNFHILNWLKNPPSTRCPWMFLLGLNMVSYLWFLQKCGCTWKFGWYSIWYIYSQNILSHKYSDCMSLYLWEPTVSLWGENARPNGFELEGIFEARNVVLVSYPH